MPGALDCRSTATATAGLKHRRLSETCGGGCACLLQGATFVSLLALLGSERSLRELIDKTGRNNNLIVPFVVGYLRKKCTA